MPPRATAAEKGKAPASRGARGRTQQGEKPQGAVVTTRRGGLVRPAAARAARFMMNAKALARVS
jgi:hypothetical protein